MASQTPGLFEHELTVADRLRNVLAQIENLREEVKVILLAAISTPSTAPVVVKRNLPKEALTEFDTQFQNRFGRRAPIVGSKDGPIMARLIERYGIEEVIVLIRNFFESHEPFIQNSGYTVGVFSSQVGRLIVNERAPRLTGSGVTAANHQSASTAAEMIRRQHL